MDSMRVLPRLQLVRVVQLAHINQIAEVMPASSVPWEHIVRLQVQRHILYVQQELINQTAELVAATTVPWEHIVRLQEHKDILYVQQELINRIVVLSRLQVV